MHVPPRMSLLTPCILPICSGRNPGEKCLGHSCWLLPSFPSSSAGQPTPAEPFGIPLLPFQLPGKEPPRAFERLLLKGSNLSYLRLRWAPPQEPVLGHRCCTPLDESISVVLTTISGVGISVFGLLIVNSLLSNENVSVFALILNNQVLTIRYNFTCVPKKNA